MSASRLPPGFFGGAEARAVAPRTFFIPAFANSAAFATDGGVLLVDCGVAPMGATIRDRLRVLCPDPVEAVVFTHGHVDHAFGFEAFDEEAQQRGRPRPRRIAHERVADRFRRYQATSGLNEHINRVQFGLPDVRWPTTYPWPDETYRDRIELAIGGERFELTHAMGETDDATWVWAPERRVAAIGDLFIGCSPNAGNPQKVQRWPGRWADALDAIAAKSPIAVLPGHGPPLEGEEIVATTLLETARWLRSLVTQTLERLNRGERPDDIVHAVSPPPDLADRWFLQPLYDRPEFVVRNVIREHAGWWSGNAADLLPAPEQRRAREIVALAGGVAPLVARARELAPSDPALACHLAEWAARAEPDSHAAQEAVRDLFQARADAEPSLMARAIFEAAVRGAKARLGAD